MRHALVVTQLVHEARSAAPRTAEAQPVHAPPDPAAPDSAASRPRRLATLFRPVRVRALGLGAESPGGGA